MICNEENLTHDFPHQAEVNQFLKVSTTPIVLTDSFPNQETNRVSWNPTSSNFVLMLSSAKLKNDVMLATQSKEYGNVNSSNDQVTDQPTSSTASPLDPTPNFVPNKLTIKPPECVIHTSKFNLNARASQNYNIFEDIDQAPSIMLNLEVLENCPTQKKAFLLAIGCINPSYSNIVVFDHESYTPQLRAQLDVMI